VVMMIFTAPPGSVRRTVHVLHEPVRDTASQPDPRAVILTGAAVPVVESHEATSRCGSVHQSSFVHPYLVSAVPHCVPSMFMRHLDPSVGH
jgi:hypothetical protein